MPRPSLLLLALVPVAASAACGIFATAPAMRSPLRDRLAAADTPTVEDAARTCLASLDWTVDPVGSLSGGSNVVSARNKDREQTQVYVHPPDQKPRVTGGPDEPRFWTCLSDKLGSPGGGDEAASKSEGPDKGDKAGKADRADDDRGGDRDDRPAAPEQAP